MDLKKKLRGNTVGKAIDLKKSVVSWDGDDYEIRQPTVAIRAEIMKQSRIAGNPNEEQETDVFAKIDYAKMQVWSAVYCTYVPGTDERIFEDTDVPQLMKKPAGSFVDVFSEEAMQLMNVNPEKSAKNSEKTAQDS